jgi:Tol biopolymer transport system component
MRFCLLLSALALAGPTPGETPGPRGEEPGPAGAGPAGIIAFASLAPRGFDLYRTDVKTGKTARLTRDAGLDYNPAFSPDGKSVAFVSDRDGNAEVYVMNADGKGPRRLTEEFALDDHPAWSPDGKRIAFVSTRRPSEKPGRAWNGLYVMNADGSGVKRLSGAAADYSPAWSPDGGWLAFASGSGKVGGTDVWVVRPDGTGRRRVVKDGGWPAFSADGKAVFFHSKRQGRWGVWRVNVDGTGLKRVTPGKEDAYTPRTSADGKWLVYAVARGGHRQVELMDLGTGKTVQVTKGGTDHWNPAVSPDGRSVVYHRARPGGSVANVERWGTPPGTGLQMFRLAGAFPAFSPDHKKLALTGGRFASVDVMNLDGTGRKTIYAGKFRGLFSISWSRTGEIAFSLGGVFGDADAKVDVVAVRPDGSGFHRLTEGSGNDGFPSWSPDGKRLVFRSGRGGSKNLYIMDAEGKEVRRLTKGKWTDTMADWSPTGEWIAFASNRDGPFEVWLVRPDGTGLRKLVAGGSRNNHPHFSPDGKWVVFTSARAGYSMEEISFPRQPQPYGDLFAVRVDGSGLMRLMHNGSEEGTPAWAPSVKVKLSGEGGKGGTDY